VNCKLDLNSLIIIQIDMMALNEMKGKDFVKEILSGRKILIILS
jgi:hypothetical protein